MDRPVISHVLFDMDGLLLDTERIYTQVTQTILDPYGKTFTWELKSQMMGLKETDAAAIFVREAQIPMTAEEYLLERNRLHEELMPTCKPLPGVMKLITHLHKHKIPIAVATSSFGKPFNLKAKNNQNLFKLFDGHITCGDDHRIKAGKPAPDIFLTAAEKLGFDMASGTEKCLVFEDAPTGVRAGLNAGMTTVWIPDVNLTRDDDLNARVAEVLTSMEDFIPEKYGLPPYSQ